MDTMDATMDHNNEKKVPAEDVDLKAVPHADIGPGDLISYGDVDPVLAAKMHLLNEVRERKMRKNEKKKKKKKTTTNNPGYQRNWLDKLPAQAVLPQRIRVRMRFATVSVAHSC